MLEIGSVLVRRVRSKLDQYRYTTTREWPFALSLVGVVIGLVTIFPSAVGFALSIAGTLLGIALILRDFRALRNRWSAYEFTQVVAPFPRAAMGPPEEYPNGRYTYFPNRGTILTSDAIDAAVQSDAFTFAPAENDYTLPARLKELAPYVLSTINRGRVVFNGPFLGLADDPLPDGPPTSARALRIHRARYFDGQCSNEICVLRATHRPTRQEFDLRVRELMSPSTGRLKTLTESDLANGIGISTLAFTTDDQLVVVPQKTRNIASGGLLAPSGSGALEPRDMAHRDDEPAFGSLQKIVSAGMARELREETGFVEDEIGETRVLGFARWLERGARPEFFGMTVLRVTGGELRRRRLSGGETLYAGRFELLPVDLLALGKELSHGGDLLASPHVPARIVDCGALPLLAGLIVCARWWYASQQVAR